MVEILQVRPRHSSLVRDHDIQLGTSLVADSMITISGQKIIENLPCRGDRRSLDCKRPLTGLDGISEFAIAGLKTVCSKCPVFTFALRASLDIQETEVLARQQK